MVDETTPIQVLFDIEEKRSANAKQWGGDDHDRYHTSNDWIALICKHAGKAAFVDPAESEDFYKHMIAVIALALDAIKANCDEWQM